MLDKCHPSVVRALEKAHWRVSPKSERIDTAYRTVYIDIKASRQNGTGLQVVLLVEVKCFDNPDNYTTDLYTAIGQYLLYRSVLREREIHYPLYLAVPHVAYTTLFDPIVKRVIQEAQINLVIVNLEQEEVQEWIEF